MTEMAVMSDAQPVSGVEPTSARTAVIKPNSNPARPTIPPMTESSLSGAAETAMSMSAPALTFFRFVQPDAPATRFVTLVVDKRLGITEVEDGQEERQVAFGKCRDGVSTRFVNTRKSSPACGYSSRVNAENVR